MKVLGINRNIKPELLPEGFCLNNKNVVYSKYVDAIVNEQGFLVHQKKGTITNEKFGIISIVNGLNTYYLKPIGARPIDNNGLLVWSCGFNIDPNVSTDVAIAEIGIVDKDGLYTSYIRDFTNAFNFNPNYPITGEFDYNYKKELITAFTDGHSNPYLVNLTFAKANPIPFQINDFLMFPNKSEVNTTIVMNNSGGNLFSGSYFPFFKYKRSDGSDTSYGISKNPILIYADNYDTSNITASQGSAPSTRTSKSITINITDVDTTFDFITISVVKCINNQFIAEEIADIPITGTTVSYLYTGNEQSTTTITVAEILTPRTVYSKIKKFTTVSKRLYGMKAETVDFDFQPYANNTTVKWVSKLKNPYFSGADSPKNQTDRFLEKSFQHREVYALYLHYILVGGVVTRGFHIPGIKPTGDRASGTGDYALSTLASAEGIPLKKYQAEDTCTVTTLAPAGESSGLMGKWENDNEQYPNTNSFLIKDASGNIIGDLKNLNVRHHRMPSIRFMKGNVYSGNSNYGRFQLDELGIEVNVTIPTEMQDVVQGWFITFAERTGSNNTIVGQSMLVNTSWSQDNNNINSLGSNGANINCQSNGSQSIFLRNDVYRFHDPVLLKTRLPLGDSYITQELQHLIKTTITDRHAPGSGSIDARTSLLLHFVDTNKNTSATTVASNEIYRKIIAKGYVNSNTKVTISGLEFDNRKLEDVLVLRMNRDLETNPNSIFLNRYDTVVDDSQLTDNTSLYKLTTINLINTNPYYGFVGQKLVNTGIIFTGTTGKTYGGDTYITYNSFTALGWGAQQNDLADVAYLSTSGIRTSYVFVCESPYPLDLRYTSSTSDNNQLYYPKNSLSFLNLINNNFNVTNSYNWDASILKVNDLTPLEVFDTYKGINTKFDYRIPRSAPLSKETLNSNWSIWLANDYYEANRNKGELTNIQGFDRNLYIQTRQATFITTGNEQLNIDAINAFVGTGNIFDREPIEILPSEEGSIGTQNMLSGVLTKVGLVTIDRENGNIWLLNGTTATNIGEGLSFWFRENLNYTIERPEFQEDNPMNLFGFTCNYDWFNDRLIIGKKFYRLTPTAIALLNASDVTIPNLRYTNGRFVLTTFGGKVIIPLSDTTYFINESWTYSYSFVTKQWVSEHDYYPDFLVNTRNLLLCFKDGFIYNTNNLNNKAIYDNTTIKDIDSANPQLATPFPSYIIPVFNFGTTESKLFYQIHWLAKVFKDEVYQPTKTFDKLLAWNDYQTTKDTILVNYAFGDFDTNTRNIKDTWFFNRLRDYLRSTYLSTETEPFIFNYSLNANTAPIDNAKEFQNIGRMIDKYLAIKLLFNNEINSNLQNEIQIQEVSCEAQLVKR